MKFRTMMLLIAAMLVFSSSTFAASAVTLNINNQMVENEDEVIYEDGILYGRIASIAERFGVETKWLGVAKLYVLTLEDKVISYGVDTDEIRVGQAVDTISLPTKLADNRLYVPMEELQAQLNFESEWDTATLTYNINDEQVAVNEDEIAKPYYSDEDVLWLARIVDVETGDASIEKRIAVANVVLNRVKDERFPNMIYDVIFASGQFPPTHKSGFDTLVPKEASIIAAKRSLAGENNISTCLYFNYIPFRGKSDDFYKNVEGDYFYY